MNLVPKAVIIRTTERPSRGSRRGNKYNVFVLDRGVHKQDMSDTTTIPRKDELKLFCERTDCVFDEKV